MRLHLLPIALCTAMLGACAADAPPPASSEAVGETAASEAPTSVRPGASVPGPGEAGNDAPPAPVATGEDAQASFNGYGDVKFGTPVADMGAAWGGELKEVGKEYNDTCYFMTPAWTKTPAEFNFMVGNGKFARVATESAKYLAPGGGKVGMSKAEIKGLYVGRIEERPHHYSDGQYLRIRDGAGGKGVLVFETDATGDDAKVTEWRVGVPPEVDYVEGCS